MNLNDLTNEELEFLKCFSIFYNIFIPYDKLIEIFSKKFLPSDLKYILDELEDKGFLATDTFAYKIKPEVKDLLKNKFDISEFSCYEILDVLSGENFDMSNVFNEIILLNFIANYELVNPKYLHIIKRYADFLLKKSDLKQAENYFNLILKFAKENSIFNNDTAEVLLKLFELENSDKKYLSELGYFFIDINNIDKKIKSLILIYMAKFNWENNNSAEALDLLDKAQKIQNDENILLKILTTKIEILIQKGKFQDVEKYLNEIEQKYKNLNPQTLFTIRELKEKTLSTLKARKKILFFTKFTLFLILILTIIVIFIILQK